MGPKIIGLPFLGTLNALHYLVGIDDRSPRATPRDKRIAIGKTPTNGSGVRLKGNEARCQ